MSEVFVPKYLIKACDKYLTSLHTVLFGQSWDVSDPKQRAEAAEWLAEQIREVAASMPKKPAKKPEPEKLCFAPRTAQSKIECEQKLGHKGPHAGRSAQNRWYTWA